MVPAEEISGCKSTLPADTRLTLFHTMLTPRERLVLDFERSWWQFPGPKDRDIRDQLGFSATLYYQVLRTAIDKPTALSYDPMTVLRSRRVRAAAELTRREQSDG